MNTPDHGTGPDIAGRMKFVDDLIDLMPAEITVRDTAGRFTLVNRAWERASNLRREQVLGRTARELFPAHRAEAMDNTDREALALRGSTWYGDLLVRGADQSYRYLEVSKTAMLDADGTPVAVLATAMDVTARHEVERALKEEQQRLSLVIQASQSGILDWDPAGRTTFYSARFKEMLGYPADYDTRGWAGLFEFMHPEDRDRARQTFISYLRASPGVGRESIHRNIEYRLRRADGDYIWVRSHALSQRNAAGRVTRYVASVSDITEAKRREEELRDQAKLTRDLIEHSPIPIYLKDAERRYVEVNPAFVRHSGIAVEQTLGRTALEIIPTERSQRYDEQDRDLLARGEGASTIEVDIPRADGMHHYLMNKTVLQRADGGIRGLLGTITEVTAIKRVQAELRASREEALQAAQAKAAFLATMSHEIRTPLNGVIGMTGILLDTRLTPEQREYVDTIRVSGEALLSVINDILDFSKIESGRLELEREPVELARVIEQCFDILGERARAKRIELLYQVADGVPAHVYGDGTCLRQVLVNLAGNALKFTDAGEVLVEVAALPAAGDGRLTLEFRVSDTGIGIPRDRLHVLFQPFAQVDASTTRKYGGTGLGLAICKRLTGLMGGTIAVESEPGRGSTFTFTIRCEPAPAPAGADPAASLGDLAGRRILIVDDNASNLRILELQLRRWGLRVAPAPGGRAALDLLARGEAFDAAVIDYQMPEMDGVALAQAIRRQAAYAALPIVLLSSSAHRQTKSGGLFAAQLLKPTRQSQLLDALVTALSGRFVKERGAAPRAAAGARLARRLPLNTLVVDDNDVNRRIALLLLKRLGYRADSAADGREAVAAAARGKYDFVLMDVQMPGMDGYEATREIAARLGAKRPVIVAMTANVMEGDREACLAAGMDDYLGKPLQPAALRDALERWGARRGAPPSGAVPRAAGSGRDRQASAVDRTRLKEIADYDDKGGSLVRAAVSSFVRDGATRVAAAGRCAKRGDAAGLAAAAHALKGSALNVGAVALAQACADIEASAREGRRAGAAALDALRRLFREAARLLRGNGGRTTGTRARARRGAATARSARGHTPGRAR